MFIIIISAPVVLWIYACGADCPADLSQAFIHGASVRRPFLASSRIESARAFAVSFWVVAAFRVRAIGKYWITALCNVLMCILRQCYWNLRELNSDSEYMYISNWILSTHRTNMPITLAGVMTLILMANVVCECVCPCRDNIFFVGLSTSLGVPRVEDSSSSTQALPRTSTKHRQWRWIIMMFFPLHFQRLSGFRGRKQYRRACVCLQSAYMSVSFHLAYVQTRPWYNTSSLAGNIVTWRADGITFFLFFLFFVLGVWQYHAGSIYACRACYLFVFHCREVAGETILQAELSRRAARGPHNARHHQWNSARGSLWWQPKDTTTAYWLRINWWLTRHACRG